MFRCVLWAEMMRYQLISEVFRDIYCSMNCKQPKMMGCFLLDSSFPLSGFNLFPHRELGKELTRTLTSLLLSSVNPFPNSVDFPYKAFPIKLY